MIILITYKNPDDNNRVYVSHGIDFYTDEIVVLQDMPLEQFSPKTFSAGLGEWIIP